MGMLLLCTLLLLANAQTVLQDGVSHRDAVGGEEGGTHLYNFHLDNPSKKDLAVALTSYSGSEPELYMSTSKEVSVSIHSYPKEGEASTLNVDYGDLCENCNYYILVVCQGPCHYRISAAHMNPIELEAGIALHGELTKKHKALYKVTLDPAVTTSLIVSLTPTSLNMALTLKILDFNNTSLDIPCTPGWHSGLICHIDAPSESEYHFNVSAQSAASYSILMTKELTVVELRAGAPTDGQVKQGKYQYYFFDFDRPEDTIVLTLTAMTGDPDLYVSVDKDPTRDSADFSAFMDGPDRLVITKHERVEKSLSTGLYHVGVYGSREATYTLLLTYNKGLFVPLTPGIQQSGYVDPKEIDLYYQDVPLEQGFNITVTVQPSTGSTFFYVKLCTSPLKKCRLTFKDLTDPAVRFSNGADSLTLPHASNSCKTSSNCRYTVAVVSADNIRAMFHVFASFDDSTVHLLRKGSPTQMSMPARGLRFFRYDVLDLGTTELKVTVTPITGDPDLFGTKNDTAAMEDYSQFEKRSTRSLTLPDSINFLRGEDGATLAGSYFFVVTSLFSFTHFTIIAVEYTPDYNSTLRLRDGYPQMDSLSSRPDSHYRIYSFSTDYSDDHKKPIKLTITPFSGAFELYVDNSLSSLDSQHMSFEYTWKLKGAKQSNRAYDLVIETTDEAYKSKGTYLAVVVAREFVKETASYMLMYRPGGRSPVHLQENTPVRDDVEEKESRFYVFTLYEVHKDITISVTAISGDPDLYVGFGYLPNRTHHDAQSSGFRGEIMTLQWEELKAVCTLPCSLYMSVLGYSSTVFEIKVVTRKDLPVMLALDSPQRDAINKTEFRYYYSVVSNELDLLVQLQSQQGDADLFVDIMDEAKAPFTPAEWQRPNLTHYLNCSRMAGAFDSVKLRSQLLKSQCVRACIVLTGVYCSAGNCEYLLYHAQGGMVLVEGSPTQATAAAGSLAYFHFYCGRKDAEIIISVTPLNEAEPEIYVARGEDKRPGSNDNDWNLTSWRGKPLILRPSDYDKSMRGHYSIGVGASTSLSFIISFSLNQLPTQLARGVLVSGATPANSASYYYFFSAQPMDVLIRVTPTAGFVTLFASPRSLNDTDDTMPSKQNHTWASTQTGNVNELHISSADKHFCMQCRINIAVVALSRNSTYTIVASTLDHITQLSNGLPVQGSVSKGGIVRYSFEVVELKSFDVGLTSLYGDGDLYVSLMANVSDSEYMWDSHTQSKVDHVRVPKTDHRFVVGVYYIAVVGQKYTGYLLTAHVRDSFIHLVDGWPQVYSVQKEDNMMFDFKVLAGQTYVCVLKTTSRDLRVHVVFQEDESTPRIPSESNADVSFTGADFQFEELRFSNHSGLPGKANIKVESDSEATFKLICASATQLHVLHENDSTFALLDSFEPLQRYLVSAEKASSMVATLESCSGRVELMVSESFEEVNSKLFPVFPISDGRIRAVVTNFKGHLYLTVKLREASSFFDGASYELSVRITSQETHNSPLQFLPGNEGRIDWSVASLGRINLNWTPPCLMDGSELPSQKNVTYRVFVSESRNVTMGTVCGMRAGEINQLTWDGYTEETITGSSLTLVVPLQRKLILNIVAAVPSEEGTQYVAYSSIEVFVSSGRGGDLSPLVIGLIVVTASVLLTLLLVYMYRFRKAQRRLEYELSDVRNVANIVSQIPEPEGSRKARRDTVYSPLQLDSSD